MNEDDDRSNMILAACSDECTVLMDPKDGSGKQIAKGPMLAAGYGIVVTPDRVVAPGRWTWSPSMRFKAAGIAPKGDRIWATDATTGDKIELKLTQTSCALVPSTKYDRALPPPRSADRIFVGTREAWIVGRDAAQRIADGTIMDLAPRYRCLGAADDDLILLVLEGDDRGSTVRLSARLPAANVPETHDLLEASDNILKEAPPARPRTRFDRPPTQLVAYLLRDKREQHGRLIERLKTETASDSTRERLLRDGAILAGATAAAPIDPTPNVLRAEERYCETGDERPLLAFVDAYDAYVTSNYARYGLRSEPTPFQPNAETRMAITERIDSVTPDVAARLLRFASPLPNEAVEDRTLDRLIDVGHPDIEALAQRTKRPRAIVRAAWARDGHAAAAAKVAESSNVAKAAVQWLLSENRYADLARFDPNAIAPFLNPHLRWVLGDDPLAAEIAAIEETDDRRRRVLLSVARLAGSSKADILLRAGDARTPEEAAKRALESGKPIEALRLGAAVPGVPARAWYMIVRKDRDVWTALVSREGSEAERDRRLRATALFRAASDPEINAVGSRSALDDATLEAICEKEAPGIKDAVRMVRQEAERAMQQ